MNPLDKKALSERDICTKFILPALYKAGWNNSQFYEEVTLNNGRILVLGQSATRDKQNRDRADFVLFYQREYPLAIIEVKKNYKMEIGAGMQQAIRYAQMVDLPFAYSSNGDGFVEHDFISGAGALERVMGLDEFPSPDELHARYQAWKNLTPAQAQIIAQPYFVGDKAPRYYQQVAINRTVEAVARGQQRVLLVMAM